MHDVAILMCTWFGERYLRAMLDSIKSQTHGNWVLYVSDDGSTDQTTLILEAFRQECGDTKCVVFFGPKKGSTANFFYLLSKVADRHTYYAYADQDDIWHSDKLERAVRALEKGGASSPKLYAGKTRLIDTQGQVLGYSPRLRRAASFSNALVQNIASGNTMVFNRETKRLMSHLAQSGNFGVLHDWTTYLVVTAVEGEVIYDPVPGVDYRQHSANQIGSGADWQSRFKRWNGLWQGEFGFYHTANDQALAEISAQMTEKNQRVWRLFQEARRHENGISRLWKIHQSGVSRQSKLQQASLLLAALLGKL